MAVTVTHNTPADGTFSASGQAAWDDAHAVSGLGTMAEQAANSVDIDGGAIDGAVIGANSAAAITGTTIGGTTVTASTQVVAPQGAVGTPGFAFAGALTTGIYGSSSILRFAFGGSQGCALSSGQLQLGPSLDASVVRAAANAVNFGPNSAGPGSATSRTEMNKTVTAFSDNVAKATFTVTIPNAAHTATLEFEFTGFLGTGGTIGINEAAATTSVKVIVTRTPGVNAVASAVSTAWGAVAANVAGSTTATIAAAVSAIAGAVGAANTFTMDVTITKAGGSSDNHVCLCYAKVMNANASGVTIA